MYATEVQPVPEKCNNWFHIIARSQIKTSIALCCFMLFLIVGIAACNQIKKEILSDAPDTAKLNFISLSDMKDWIEDAPNLRWGIAMSSKDITNIHEKDGNHYNEPAISAAEYDRYVITSNIQTGEAISLKINPGTYDWLIIIDEDNDGTWDSYLGSIEQDIQLNSMQFLANETYEVIVGTDSIPRLNHVDKD